MGLIDSVSSIKKELNYNEKQAQARYTQSQIKSKYKNDIENTTLAYLDKYYSKYGNFDLLFYNRYEYIQFIIDDISKNDINRLYNNFDIALDVNKSFLKIFKQFKQVKEYDLKIESKYNINCINENKHDEVDQDYKQIEKLLVDSLFLVILIKLISLVKHDIVASITLLIILLIAHLIYSKFKKYMRRWKPSFFFGMIYSKKQLTINTLNLPIFKPIELWK